MGDPAGQPRSKPLGDVRPDVEIAAGGAAAEPVDRAADREVHAPPRDVERKYSGRLVDVEKDESADPARPFDDRPGIDPMGAAIGDV